MVIYINKSIVGSLTQLLCTKISASERRKNSISFMIIIIIIDEVATSIVS